MPYLPSDGAHAHAPVQHRDGKSPWCKTCGLDASGQVPVSRLPRPEVTRPARAEVHLPPRPGQR